MRKLFFILPLAIFVSCAKQQDTTLVNDFFMFTSSNQVQKFMDKYSMADLSNGEGKFIQSADTLINVKKFKNDSGADKFYLTLSVSHINKEKRDEIAALYKAKFNLTSAVAKDGSDTETYETPAFTFEFLKSNELSIDAYEK